MDVVQLGPVISMIGGAAAAVVVVIRDLWRPVQPPYRRRSVRPEVTLNLE